MNRLAPALAAAMLAAACQRTEPPPDPQTAITGIRGLADRACACKGEPGCIKYVRAEWEQHEQAWEAARASFDDVQRSLYDSQALVMSACGEAAGLPFRPRP